MYKNEFARLCLVSTTLLSGMLIPVKADITVRLPKGSKIETLDVTHYPISKMSTATKFDELGVIKETVPVINEEAVIKTDSKDSYAYSISSGQEFQEMVYLDKGDNVLIEIASVAPYYSVASGSEIMDDITSINQNMEGLKNEVMKLRESGVEMTREKMDSIRNQVYSIYADFIEENPTSPVVAYAVSKLDDEKFDYYSSRLSEGVKASILYPLVQSRLNYEEAKKATERKLKELQSGAVEAPAFSLEDLKGENISLSAFRGKWVILDFWGSWCIWCIKGFPELKEAYSHYAGKLEVIGIDCRESKEDWREGVRKYELPWVNLYCPEGNPILKEYGVQSFPTKAIIDPEGKIRNITVGHNPDFFTQLKSLLGE